MNGQDRLTERPLLHGGDLREAQALFPQALRPWIDLSTGINPHPYPVPALPPDTLTRLPSPGDVEDLEAAAAAAYGVTEPGLVAAAPGTQALIQILPRLRPPGRVAIVGPTYGEHARSWARAGHIPVAVADLAQACAAAPDVVVVVNPNNPDGRRTAPSDLAGAAAALGARRSWLVVDEAFADLEEDVSLAPAMPIAGVIILRSFGKSYGLAGVRLGFAIADRDIIQAIKAELGPWAISGQAIAIGRTALPDRLWRRTEAARLAISAERLDAALNQAGFEVIGGTRLFRLTRHASAPDWFARFGRRGLWVRRFASDQTILRFANPSPDGWNRLAAVLGKN